MGKRTALIATLAVLCAACGLGLVLAIRKIRSGGAVAGASGRFGRDTLAVITVDVAQARTWPVATALRDWALHPGDAGGDTQQVSVEYQRLIAGCGFDPWLKLDSIALGIDRSQLASAGGTAAAAFVNGSFTQAEARRCLEHVASRDQRTLSPTQVGSHTALTALRPGASRTPRSTQFVLLERSVLVAEEAFLGRALAVVDGRAPALEATAPVRAMLTRLGSNRLASAALDLSALRAHDARDVDALVDQFVRDNPRIPDLTLARQAQVGGITLDVASGRVTVLARLEFPQATVATPFSAALGSFVETRRGEARQALGQLQTALTAMQAMASLTGSGLGPQFTRAGAGITVLQQLLDQVTVTTEGTATVATLVVQAAQVTTLEAAVRAASAILPEVLRSARPGRRDTRDEPEAQPSTPAPPRPDLFNGVIRPTL